MQMSGLDGGRLSIGACSLGAAQACFEMALAYSKERKQFGKPVAENQAMQVSLRLKGLFLYTVDFVCNVE